MEILERHGRYVVEKIFEHKGLKCVVTFGIRGWRCGYVGVPKGHRFYGKNYTEIESQINYGNCHGGLTFSSKNEDTNYPIESDLWWFGFDCAHHGDGNDLDLAINLFPHLDESIRTKRIELFQLDGAIRSCDYVTENCISLADQLAEYSN